MDSQKLVCLPWIQSYSLFNGEGLVYAKKSNKFYVWSIHGVLQILGSTNLNESIKCNKIPTVTRIYDDSVKKVSSIAVIWDENDTLRNLDGMILARQILSMEENVIVLKDDEGIKIQIVGSKWDMFPCGPAVEGKFRAKMFQITNSQIKPLEVLVDKNFEGSEELIFFSNGSTLYWFEVAENFMIRVAKCVSSEISNFWLANEKLICLLDDGTVEVSSVEGTASVKSTLIHLYSHELWSIDVFGDHLLVSNGKDIKIVDLGKSNFPRSVIYLPGIVSVTFCEDINACLALSENNLLYVIHLEIPTIKSEDSVEVDEMFINIGNVLENEIEKTVKELELVEDLIQKNADQQNVFNSIITPKPNSHEYLSQIKVFNQLFILENGGTLKFIEKWHECNKLLANRAKLCCLISHDLMIVNPISDTTINARNVRAKSDSVQRIYEKMFNISSIPLEYHVKLPQESEEQFFNLDMVGILSLKGNSPKELETNKSWAFKRLETLGQVEVVKVCGDCKGYNKTERKMPDSSNDRKEMCLSEIEIILLSMEGGKLSLENFLECYKNLRKSCLLLKVK